MASVARTPGGAYKARACIGKDPLTGKQIWRVKNFKPLDTLTPAKAEKEVMRRIQDWEAQQRADHEAGLDQHRDKMPLALMNGADIKAIQATLGHSRPSLTLQFYSGISERANRAAVNALERAVKPKQDAPEA